MSTHVPSRVNPIYIAQVEARKSTVAANAQARFAAIKAALDPLTPDFDKRLAAIATMPGSRKKKMAAFLELVSDMRKVASPFIACKKGCSACCYQRVVISTLEADLISAKTGRMAKIVITGAPVKPEEEFGKSTPCSFLDSHGECSIYEYRPYMCRNFVTLDVDNLLCQPENIELAAEKHPATTGIPLLTPGPLGVLYGQITKGDALNDIRAFFP